VEGFFVGLVGSALGALGGFLLTLAQVGLNIGFDLLSPAAVFGTLAFSLPVAVAGGTALTVLAAVYPTLTAAKMKPVDAMRTEV
jgi:ABC-type antimicrobial peptide transport system permease subunit